jgi:hypothetical protein
LVPGTKDTNEFAAIAQDKKEFLFKFVLAPGDIKFVELQSWWLWVVQEQPYRSKAQTDMRPLLSVRSSNCAAVVNIWGGSCGAP